MVALWMRFALAEDNEGFREYAKLRPRLLAHYYGRIVVGVQISRDSCLSCYSRAKFAEGRFVVTHIL